MTPKGAVESLDTVHIEPHRIIRFDFHSSICILGTRVSKL